MGLREGEGRGGHRVLGNASNPGDLRCPLSQSQFSRNRGLLGSAPVEINARAARRVYSRAELTAEKVGTNLYNFRHTVPVSVFVAPC